MNEHSSQLPQKQGLKNEWALLVHSFVESSDDVKPTLLEKIQKSGLKPDDLSLHTKTLSQNRKNLNLQIEAIKSKIDRLLTVSENLELVGSNTEGIHEDIQMLNNEGEKLSAEVIDLEKKIKKIREIEKVISTSSDRSTL
jgi:prefoldin subunit 5